jgi:Stage II sporulation protein E (SpoIIE)
MKKIALLLVVLSVSPLVCSSQTVSPATAARVITLDNSAVPLDGEWKFEPGDSPWVNGAPEWAEPGFDDSHWAAMDVTPKAGAVDLEFGTAGYVPGWTQKGFPKLSGYAWYRLRVKVTNPSQPLWLKMPDDFDDAYQVYANGRFVGQYGAFRGGHVTEYYSNPASFALPEPGANGEIVLAVRFYMTAVSQFQNPDAGGMHGAPMLGLAPTVHLLQAAGYEASLRSYFSLLLHLLFVLLVLPLALWAWLYNREERAWLWLSLALVWNLVAGVVSALSDLSTAVSIGDYNAVSIIDLPLWTMFWWYWFGLKEKRWIVRALWVLAAAATLDGFCAQSPNFNLSFVPLSELHWFIDAAIWFGVAIGLLGVVILIEGFRRDRTEALLAAFPILLGLFNPWTNYLLVAFHIPYQHFFFGLGFAVGDMVLMLMIVVVGALALRRFMKTQVRESLARQAIRQDLEQAQQLQQRVLIPETIASKYFTVEAEYRPAQTVGGDFFQTLEKPDGSLLVVIGDVSGKGVSAAMLVAVLVGAIRSQAHFSFDPVSMLAMLNERMQGRSGGHFATCVAAELRPDGTMRIANAGHLPPYLNGGEMDLEGSLPLGVVAESEVTAQTFMLKRGDWVTFMTDGVVEATNPAKELFGFERTREISREHAAAIAEQAQSFGQEDDITVVSVSFAAAA